MNEKLTKEKAEELMKVEGETRGVTIKTDWTYVKENHGEEALKKVEERMAELGYPLKYDEIEVMDFYPLGLDVLSVHIVKEVLGLDREGLIKMGEEAVKFSVFLKIIFRYLPSFSLLTREAPRMWRKHYTVGNLEVKEADREKRRIVLAIKNLKVTPSFSQGIQGYLYKMIKIITGRKDLKMREEKCVFKGDDVCQFVFTWDENNGDEEKEKK